jgi:transcription elongation factor Elf1
MIFNITKFLTDYRVEFRTSGSQISSGWLGLNCPFCGKDNFGLGIHLESSAINCWKCGHHSLVDLIKALVGCDYHSARDIQSEYASNTRAKHNLTQNEAVRTTKTICEYATNTTTMNERHRAYLEKRNYDPELLEELWGLKGTGNVGDYRFRVVAPIMYRGKMVSYTCRDYTGKSELKWKTCKAENEVIPHKNILYGLDYCKSNSCLVVEGPGDVWRMGYGSVSTFGTSFKLEQAMLLADRFKRVFILFDAEDKAQEQARSLAVLLNARRVEVELLEIQEGDPGELDQDEANNIMKEIGL